MVEGKCLQSAGLNIKLTECCLLLLPFTMPQVVRTNQAYSFNLDAGPSSDPLAQERGGVSSSSPSGLLDLHGVSDAEEGFKTESGGDVQHEHNNKGDLVVNWPEGEHPLQGVPNFIDLPTAEPVR